MSGNSFDLEFSETDPNFTLGFGEVFSSGSNDHAQLYHLSYETSGHTGFASSASVNNITAVIPTEATTGNKLADKSYVGTQITNATTPLASKLWVQDQGFLTEEDIENKEKIENKVTSINSSRTDDQYPSAKAVYAYHDSTKADVSAIPTKTSDLTNDSGFLTSHQSLSAYRTSALQDVIDLSKESANNKVTSINSTSTDAQYPSAKCVYDIVGDIETLLEGML